MPWGPIGRIGLLHEGLEALGRFYLRRGAGAFIFLQLVPLVITPVVAALFIKWIFVARWGLIDASLAMRRQPPQAQPPASPSPALS